MADLPRITTDDGVFTFLKKTDQPDNKMEGVETILKSINDNIVRMSLGLNVKMASIAMILSDFFEGVTQSKMLDNSDQVRKPPKLEDEKKDSRFKFPELDASSIGGWLSTILTGLGVAFLASRVGIDKAIQESGIFAYLARGVAKGVMVATGMSKIVSAISKNSTLATIGGMVSKVFNAFNSVAKAIVPFYAQALSLAKGVGKFLPFIAMITTVVDFMRGFSRGEGALEGIKEGLAEVAAGWIGWPLNILKNIIGWVAGKFGLENIESWLGGLDFVEPVRNLVRITFDTIKDVFTIDTDRLTDFSYWKQKIFDLLYLPVNVGVNFIKSIFSIGDLDTPFRMSEFIASVVQQANNLMAAIFSFDYATAFSELFASTVAFVKEKMSNLWEGVKTSVTDGLNLAAETIKNELYSIINDVTAMFTDIFAKIKSYIPTTDSITQKLIDNLPDFMIPDSIKQPEQRIRELDAAINEQTDLIRRSKDGEDVFWGAEDRGRGIAQSKIDEANRLRNEMVQQRNAAMNVTGPTNVIVGGSTTNNASNMSFTQMTQAPSNGRPD
jgi:hypothetical protein